MSSWYEEFRPQMEKHCEYAMYMGGSQPPADTSVMIVPNTPETFHFVLPPDPNALLADADLNAVVGGIGSAGCRSSLVSCIGGCPAAGQVDPNACV